jgi:diamine N-acetyltransferase
MNYILWNAREVRHFWVSPFHFLNEYGKGMMEMIIRKAKREDAGVLSRLAFRSKAFWGYSDDFLEACREDLTVSPEFIDTSDVFVAELEDEIIAFYSLVRSKVKGELRDFFVAPEMIGKGIGKKLWEHMTETARKLQIQKVFIHSDPNAERFYEAMGAKRIGEVVSSVFPNRKLPLMEYQIEDVEPKADEEKVEIFFTTATMADYEQINEIVKEGQDEHAKHLPKIFAKTNTPMPMDYFQHLLHDQNSEILIAKIKEQIVAFAVLELKKTPPFDSLVPRTYAYVSDFGVKELFQNKGIGTELFSACVRWAKERGASSLELNVWEFNEKAISFYERLGMKTLSRKMGIDL